MLSSLRLPLDSIDLLLLANSQDSSNGFAGKHDGLVSFSVIVQYYDWFLNEKSDPGLSIFVSCNAVPQRR